MGHILSKAITVVQLEIDNVELYRGGKTILQGVYLKATTGTITAILGRNGNGKSSLLKVAFGQIQPKYKGVRLDGRLIRQPLYQTKKVKFLPQGSFLPGYLSLKRLFYLFKAEWDKFITLFPAFVGQQQERFKSLSGGQQRLVEIYCILTSKSEIVLLDEPFTHLAPVFVESITQLIEEEKSKKIIILTDHNYDMVMHLADQLYLMKNGATSLVKNRDDLRRSGYISK